MKKLVNNRNGFLTPNKAKIIVTIVLFGFLILGFFGFFPFGNETYGRGQDINPLLIVPVYLLNGVEFNSLFIPTLLILLYYYLISCVLIFIYKQIKRKNK